jgi:DNA polymerase kappa
MDAFFASVEIRDAPHLALVPMAVGTLTMLTTSNYAARQFGVRAAMPGFIARRLCPQLVLVPPCFEKYAAAAAETRVVFAGAL